jgi:eukaryotic-like serine/threonine-protein kinase
MSDTHLLPAVSPEEARQIIQASDRFEAAWKARPRPEAYLGTAVGPARSALLRQLLMLDWEYRRRAGDKPRAADYHARFPGDSALVEDVGRAMTGALDSSEMRPDERHAPDTHWAGDQAPDRADEAVPGVEAGSARYELVQAVGQGGTGVVYRGRDRVLGCEVAVKVLRADCRDRPDVRRRFVAEARVGGQLQHPAIVPVYEQGRFADGRPYFAMKLVEGHTLAELLRARADPTQDLQHLLGVFGQVCQAVAYAHSRGVVHRDLKPANVMVGAFGEVQVMDWGFAKVAVSDQPAVDGDQATSSPPPPATGCPPTDDRTQSGVLLGTPAYMPPEQARGEAALIDPRADVFALGAMLCEILTGRPPYDGGSVDEVCRRAAEGNLGAAHARLDACGADPALRELAKRCLAAERTERPADAGGVARAVADYLASAQERLRRTEVERAAAEARAQGARAKAQAERRWLRLALALAAALLLGAGAAAWQAVVATRAKQDALDAAEAQRVARETADDKEAETRAMLDFVQNRILAAARPENLEGGLGRDVTLQRALELALPAVDESFARQPLTEARLRMTLGKSFLYLSKPDIAAEQFERARTLYTRHRGPDHPDTLASLNSLGSSFVFLGRHDDAFTLLQETLERRSATLGPDHPDTLGTMNGLTGVYAALGRYADALKLGEEVLARRRATLGPDHPDTLVSMYNLAHGYMYHSRYADALKLGEEVLARWKATLGPDHPDTLDCMNDVANYYGLLGRHEDALKLLQETLALRKEKMGPHHMSTLQTMANLATSYSDLGLHTDALKLREETLALQKAHLPPGHPDTLAGMHNLGNTYARVGRHADALKLRQETLVLREDKLGPTHPDTLRSMKALAESLVQFDRGAEAVVVIDDCVRRSAGQVVPPKLIPGIMDLRLRHFEKAKDAAGCRATAEMWENLQRTDGANLYTAARYRAVTAAVLRAADTPPPAAEQAGAEADRAMTWLKRAVAAEYKDVADIRKNKDLDVLRNRADFRKLLAELGAGS